MKNQSAGHWWQTLRPLFWWVLIVLIFFGIHTHQRLMEKTRLVFTVTLQGQSPNDATATLDGQPAMGGQKISLGSHNFSVSQPKAESFGTNFFVWYGRNNLGEIKLKRSQGMLNVQSRPPASTIIITGPEFSTTLYGIAATNLTVPTDAYEIRAGYPHWSESKNVTVFNQTTASGIFSPQFGALHLTCNHEGASYALVDANGQNVDSGNLSAVVGGLPPGSYQMTVSYHQHQQQKSVMVAAGETNEAAFEFTLGVARIESVPTGADVLTPDGRNLGQTPLEVPDLSPQTAQFNLSLRGYEPGSVSVVVVADQTTTARTNLLSLRYGQALAEARQYLDAANYEAALRATGEALALKSDSGEAVALQATATERLNAARQQADAAQQRADAEKQRVEAERKQAEIVRQNAERLKRPGLVFAALCAQNPDAALFTEQKVTTSKPAKEVEAAIVKSLQVAPWAYQISSDGMQQPGIYQVTAQETFSLGILGGNQRVCLLVVGQAKDDETQILFKVVEYQIQHNIVNLHDEKQMIPMHPSRMQMTEVNQTHIQTGIRDLTARIDAALQQVQ